MRYWTAQVLGKMKLPFHRMAGLAKSRLAPGALAGLVLGACFQFVSVGCARADAQVNSLAMGSPFAIADFDGDRLPDLASVQVAMSRNSEIQYWIRFQLSTGARQSIGITAPVGGLQLLSRDVNGDSFLDVVVTTEFLHRPIAVLLNDGHGHFALKDPAAFPGAIWTAESLWTTPLLQIRDAAFNFPPRSLSGDAGEHATIFSPRDVRGILGSGDYRDPAISPAFSVHGRAPPTFVHHV
jgi:hypothetical protein